jgi:phenylacetate-CoA ligase
MTEFGLVASECTHENLHVDTSSVYVEVLDDTGTPVPSGVVGEIVLSSNSNLAVPLLRYQTGDLGTLLTTPCPCGGYSPRIDSLQGRKIKCFVLPSGALFPPTCFNDMFKRFPELSEFQVTEIAVGNFQVRVEFKQGRVQKDDSLRRVKQHFLATIPADIEIEVLEAAFVFDSKFERYRSNL